MDVFDAPQMYRWRDPSWPPHIPSLSVHFIESPEVNKEETEKTGIQTYDNVLVAVVAPIGMPKSDAHFEIQRVKPDGTVVINHAVAAKYGEQFKHYKDGHSSEATGTPLRDLIGMTPATIMNLKARGIHTVEMLAEMPDGGGQDIMGFWGFRDSAKKHLELREKNAPMLKIEAIEARHKEEVDGLRHELEELKRALAENGPKAKKAA